MVGVVTVSSCVVADVGHVSGNGLVPLKRKSKIPEKQVINTYITIYV